MSCPSSPLGSIDAMFTRAAETLQPIMAHLELTRRCHLDCTLCYQVDDSESPELTTAEWLRVIDELRDLGTLFVTFSGGEVFLRKDAMAIARHARASGLSFKIATTGTLFDEARADELAALYPQQVEVTIFSLDPTLHDGVTRTPGSLEETVAGVRRLRARGVEVLIKTPLVRSAWRSFGDIGLLARELGASHMVDPTLTARDDGDRTPYADRLPLAALAELFGREEIPAELHAPAQAEDETCKVARHFLVVGPKGDLLPCVSVPVPIGNVKRDRIADVWRDHPFLAELRRITHGSLHTCGGCEKSGYCGRCPGMALIEDDDLYGPSSHACETAAAKEIAALGYERPGPSGRRAPRGVRSRRLQVVP